MDYNSNGTIDHKVVTLLKVGLSDLGGRGGQPHICNKLSIVTCVIKVKM